jgi:hypothetical protein
MWLRVLASRWSEPHLPLHDAVVAAMWHVLRGCVGVSRSVSGTPKLQIIEQIGMCLTVEGNVGTVTGWSRRPIQNADASTQQVLLDS